MVGGGVPALFLLREQEVPGDPLISQDLGLGRAAPAHSHYNRRLPLPGQVTRHLGRDGRFTAAFPGSDNGTGGPGQDLLETRWPELEIRAAVGGSSRQRPGGKLHSLRRTQYREIAQVHHQLRLQAQQCRVEIRKRVFGDDELRFFQFKLGEILELLPAAQEIKAYRLPVLSALQLPYGIQGSGGVVFAVHQI
jgi:hypothetical protein